MKRLLDRLPPRERRALVVGAVVLSVGLLAGKGFPALLRLQGTRQDRVHRLTIQLATQRAAVASLAAVRESADARKQRIVDLGPRVLEGRSLAAAGVSLSALVASHAAVAGADLGSTEIQSAPSANRYFVPVRLRGDATGDAPQIFRMLGLFGSGPEFLRLIDWRLSPIGEGEVGELQQLRLDFVIEGLAAPERLMQ